MSHHAEYVRERMGHEILETEHGFATYSFPDEKTAYIIDLYVAPDYRKGRIASDMADTIAGIARKRGCTKMLGSVLISSKDPTTSVKVLLGYGMKVLSVGPDCIWFSKEL